MQGKRTQEGYGKQTLDKINKPSGLLFYAIESIKADQISPSGKCAIIVTGSFFTG